MCTLDELQQDVKNLTKAIQNGNEQLPGATVTISKFMGEIKDHIKDTHQAIDRNTRLLEKHNGRLSKVEAWKLRLQGMQIATKTIWGLLSVFIVASVFGLFNMYVTYQTLPHTVADIVKEELQDYQFEVTE
jgi:hypothetical protein